MGQRPSLRATVTAATLTRPRLGRAARRATIIDGAARVFARSGFAATTMADITDAVGVSHLIVYRHFDSKEALYISILDQAIEDLREALRAPGSIGPYGPTPGALLAGARRHPDAFRVLWRHAPREREFAHHGERANRLVTGPTREALAPIVPDDALTWASRATVTYVIQAVLGWVEAGDSRQDARFSTATTAALRAGVRSWSAP